MKECYKNILFIPTTDLSGGGGTTRPYNKCFSFNLSYKPKKSLNRRLTVNSELLNAGMEV